MFNFILKPGFYPNIWRDNIYIIKPIYKGEGTQDPSNYSIAVFSCFSKLFSRILFNRLDIVNNYPMTKINRFIT